MQAQTREKILQNITMKISKKVVYFPYLDVPGCYAVRKVLAGRMNAFFACTFILHTRKLIKHYGFLVLWFYTSHAYFTHFYICIFIHKHYFLFKIFTPIEHYYPNKWKNILIFIWNIHTKIFLRTDHDNWDVNLV